MKHWDYYAQNDFEKEHLLADFFENVQWKNSKDRRLTDREMIDFANEIGYGWERISYKFACSFIHLSVLHNWNNEDVTEIINANDKKIIIDYINQYHSANLNIDCTFEDILQYSLDIFEKIKGNMEYYLNELEK